MSEMYGFGAGEMSGEPSGQEPQGPKWFREYMDKVSGQLQSLQERNAQLEQAQRQTQVAEALKAKGYAPQAAGLFTGDPNTLDDWLSANGAALAKTGGEAAEQDQGVQGTPQTVVPPESQAAMAAIAAAGTGGAGPLSGDDQMAARLEAAGEDEAAFNAIMREAGNRRF